jgi:hypothetical protein
MTRRTQVKLTAEQEAELMQVRDRHRKPYMRERVAGVLKVAAGESVNQVALPGLLRPHEPETVSGWIEQYLAEGLAGWSVKPGRGRKPGFSPSDCSGSAGRSGALSIPDPE